VVRVGQVLALMALLEHGNMRLDGGIGPHARLYNCGFKLGLPYLTPPHFQCDCTGKKVAVPRRYANFYYHIPSYDVTFTFIWHAQSIVKVCPPQRDLRACCGVLCTLV
jgi:hypothetical protein